MISTALNERIRLLKQQGLHRQRVLASCPDKELGLNFSSSDYLSLTEEDKVKKAFQKGFSNYPSGSGGSMVICGYHASHRALEQAFSQALGVDDALLFSSGYAANLGIISVLAQFNSHILIDKAAHASFYDGIRLSDSHYSRYLHNNLEHLSAKLQLKPINPVVIAESVFSMSGQATNLQVLTELCLQYQADCIVDEAHAFGVMGPEGLGAVIGYGLNQDQVPLRVIPLGKAFAFQGAIVAGRGEWIDALLQFARSHRYSTAVSPALAFGLLETLSFIRAADERRKKLYDLIEYFQKRRENSPLNWRTSRTPIQQLQLGCPYKALGYANYLRTKGVFCQAMREPTVSRKESGLRVILNYRHETESIDILFSLLHQFAESEGNLGLMHEPEC